MSKNGQALALQSVVAGEGIFSLSQRPAPQRPPLPVKEVPSESAATNEKIIELLKTHAGIVPHQEKRFHSEKLPFSEDSLLERSKSYAASALRRAERLGILNKSRKLPSTKLSLSRIQDTKLVIKGQGHFCSASECQDAVVSAKDQKSYVAVVADGAGAFELSHFGSQLLANEALQITQRLINEQEGFGGLLHENFLGELYKRLYLRFHHLIKYIGVHPGTAYKTFLASTVQILIITPEESMVLSLGDGYLQWQDRLESIEEKTERSSRLVDFNHPPLFICSLAFDAGAAPIRSCDEQIRVALHEEAKSFDIIAYGPSAEVLKNPLLLSTDGIRFSAALAPANEVEVSFPLAELLAHYSADTVKNIAHIYNLATPSPRGESKLELVKELINSELIAQTDFNCELQRVILEQFASVFARDFELSQRMKACTAKELLELLSKGVLSYKTEVAAARAVAEERAVAIARKVLSEHFNIATSDRSQSLWDDVGLVTVQLEKLNIPSW